ncbi:Ubiquitin carboxyl-terminal hydrolase 27 [Linum perenne]
MIQNYFSSPQMKWGLASGFHLPLAAAVLGAAGFVVAVIRHRQLGNLSGLLKGRREEVLLVPGLQNLGNNCFLNVILQALASCSLFQPFLQKMIEDCESDDWGDGLQLTVALASLLEDLCACGEGKVVLSPRQVMLAMAQYIRNFNLTSQQDAEEAFLHLLSSLREEFSDCYLPKQSSLSEIVDTFYSRILTPKRHETRNEKERWQQHFLGPFDGILSSTLICQTCSSQISLNFQFFHSLPLSPVRGFGAPIMVGCTLEDCLKRFIAAEQLENYHCSHCWHVAAVKYLCLQGALEGDVEKIMRCTERDSCTCRSLFDLDSLPWSNIFSRTLKGLSIARCPKILCIHLQRASINHFGEPIKLQGHICFPLVLDLLPFTLKELQSEKRIPHSNKPNMPSDPEVRACISGQDLPSEELLAEDKLGCSEQLQTIAGESKLVETKVDVEIITDTIFPNQDKFSQVLSSDAYMYRLVSVVEHFGRSGGGHYTVYRSAKCDSPEDSVQNLHWFCVSDSQVSRVSEEDVLAAEASLLFYERIAQC